MNAISYMIKYLPRLIVKFQAAIHKNLLLARCRAFGHVERTTIYKIKIFYREFVLLQSIDSRVKNLSKYIFPILKLFKGLVKRFHINSIISIRP